MTFSNLCNEIFWKSTTDYHVTDSVDAPMNNPYELKTIEYYLYLKNWIDAVQWHFEDIIRDPQIDPVEALALKRRIDKSNQDRTDLVELIDSYFLDKYKEVKPLSDATINTESPAWAIDRLSILALKIYHMQQEVERTDTTEEHRLQCQTKLNILLEQRKDLSTAIEQLLADIEAGRKYMKVYKQMKMYNDPALNPVLYAKKYRMALILIIRFSALGDVAMTIPVIHSLAVQYPQHEITVLSRAVWQPLFQGLPANVGFVGADLTGKHKGLWGLNSLYSELKAMHFDYIADFHHVLRSKYLCLRFRLANKPVASICKGRAGKKKLVRRHDKVMENQKSSFRRYADVLEKLGLPVLLNFSSIYGEGKGNFAEIEPVTGPKENQKWIGIAPFAKHIGKIYPLELQEQVIAHFAANPQVKVFLFGGGKSEQEVFDTWIAKYPSVVSMIGKLNMRTELNLMSHLDVMLSMDSANMHLASLVNIPVVSIWGATHPYAGFMGWKQLPVNTVQLDLSCRPCSVYGQKPCWRGDYACLRDIKPEQVIAKIEGIVG